MDKIFDEIGQIRNDLTTKGKIVETKTNPYVMTGNHDMDEQNLAFLNDEMMEFKPFIIGEYVTHACGVNFLDD